ncbi:MAG: DUF488 domain-containing protein [Planctomycetes bacterium]|nr:DUF488 domain-containing protein [Planctomycetota bacterium]
MVYTIGHSTQSIERFVELLKKHSITVICDVRSTPYSRMNPQFNREPLRDTLKEEGIAYVFLGEELGARSKDPSCYRHGRVDYELLARTELFHSGLERVREGARTHRIALMCAEKDPLDCHRTILVARNLVEQGVTVSHILSDGSVESHDQSVSRLMEMLRIGENDLFRPSENAVRDAYRKRGEAIAYTEQTDQTQQGAKVH